MPECPHLHEMGPTAGKNKHAKAHEDPIEGHISSLAYEKKQCDRDRQICQRDQRIGNDVQPHQCCIPRIAITVWHEIIGREKRFEGFHDLRPITDLLSHFNSRAVYPVI